MSDLNTFRRETRAWLETNCPESMRKTAKSEKDFYWGGRKGSFQSEDQKVWFERMLDKRWIVPYWPEKYGGGGLDKEENKILNREMKRLNCRMPLSSFGIWMLGPALLKFGSEEQKMEHIPKIIRGEIRWCQGYSEPGAGSDLASLQTGAVSDGDSYVVNGQKIWTSYADKADWIFCLVRTNTEMPKHQGISFLLIDMADPGVSTSPIKLISGSSPFCQTFFDNVRVPKANLIGEENKGWTIAKYLLTHEREMISSMDMGAEKSLGQIATEAIGKEDGKLSDATLRYRTAKLEMNATAFLLTIQRTKDEAKIGQSLGAQSSFLKYYGTELNKARHELILSLEGTKSLGWEGDTFNGGSIARNWLRTKGNSIEGGTSEVQLNVISKRILGLPG